MTMPDYEGDHLNSPEFLDWFRGVEEFVAITTRVLIEAGGVQTIAGREAAEHNARAILARMARHDPPLTVEWMKDDMKQHPSPTLG